MINTLKFPFYVVIHTIELLDELLDSQNCFDLHLYNGEATLC